MARCSLLQSGCPTSLWAKAVNTAVYLRNRCPSRPTGNKTPLELWSGKKPNVSGLKTFGSHVTALRKGPGITKECEGRRFCICRIFYRIKGISVVAQRYNANNQELRCSFHRRPPLCNPRVTRKRRVAVSIREYKTRGYTYVGAQAQSIIR